MPYIIVHKKSGTFDSMLKTSVYFGSKKLGDIKNGTTQKFEVPAGKNTLKAKPSLMALNAAAQSDINLSENDVQEVVIGYGKFSKLSGLFLYAGIACIIAGFFAQYFEHTLKLSESFLYSSLLITLLFIFLKSVRLYPLSIEPGPGKQ